MGASAAAAQLNYPYSVAVDVAGNVYVADTVNEVIRYISFATSSVNFGTQPFRTSSIAQSVVLSNAGTATLNISNIAVAGTNSADFAQTNACGNGLAPGASCTISVVFTPSSAGNRAASIVITTNAAGSPQTVALSGIGQAAAQDALSSSAISFGTQVLQSSSATQSVILSNSGTTTLVISSIALGGTNPGDFAETTNCGSSVSPGANCTISAVFTPTVVGNRAASIVVTTNAAGSPQTVTLSGVGQGTPQAVLSSSAISFGSQTLQSTSATQSVTLSNPGTAVLTMSSIAVAGTNPVDFAQTNTCGSSLATGASCTISVVFTPVAVGSRAASIVITTNAAGSPQTVAVSGVGQGTPQAVLSSSSISFGSQALQSSSAAQSVTLSNPGTAALTISSIAVAGTNSADFAQTNTCGSSLAPSASCAISIVFTPPVVGNRAASIIVTTNAAGSPQTITLSGTGQGVPQAVLSSSAISFGSQTLQSSSAPQSVTLSNSGTAALSISSIVLGGTNPADFAQTSTCSTSLAPGANCAISVVFTPTVVGNRAVSIVITTNAAGSPQTVAVSGVGQGTPQAVLSSSSISFGSQTLQSSSAAQSVTLSNSGTAALTISSIALAGANSADFAQTNTCGSSLATGASCTISVVFTPAAVGSRAASIVITTNAAGSPQTAAVSGVGQGTPQAVLSSSSISFGTQALQSSSAAQSVTLTNSGTAALTISNIAVAGTNPADFAQTNTCTASLAPSASCTISVVFTPTATGNRAASIVVTTNAAGSPQTVAVSGVGQGTPQAVLSSSSISFGTQALQSSSAAQSVTLSNPGTAVLTMSSIAVAGINPVDFGQTNTCGSSLATGASCTISVVFTPVAVGSRAASIVITTNAAGSPQTVAVSGVGQGTPQAVLSSSSISFGSQTLQSSSAAQSVTLTNSGTAALTISSIALAGTNPADFAQTNTCGSSLATGASCTISVVFTPVAVGSRAASIVITTNAAGSPQTVAVSGVGQGTPQAVLSSSSISFGSQTLQSSSAAQSVTLSNPGTAVLTMSSIAVAGTNPVDFAQTNTCGSSLAPNASCAISVVFTPIAVGNRTASIVVTTNAVGSPQTITLSGIGPGRVADRSKFFVDQLWKPDAAEQQRRTERDSEQFGNRCFDHQQYCGCRH